MYKRQFYAIGKNVLCNKNSFHTCKEVQERRISMYQKVTTDLNFVEREKNVEKFWKDNDIFKKSMEQKKQGETYTFYDGPPTALSLIHI